jgi:hypothetical protein
MDMWVGRYLGKKRQYNSGGVLYQTGSEGESLHVSKENEK